MGGLSSERKEEKSVGLAGTVAVTEMLSLVTIESANSWVSIVAFVTSRVLKVPTNVPVDEGVVIVPEAK